MYFEAYHKTPQIELLASKYYYCNLRNHYYLLPSNNNTSRYSVEPFQTLTIFHHRSRLYKELRSDLCKDTLSPNNTPSASQGLLKVDASQETEKVEHEVNNHAEEEIGVGTERYTICYCSL